MANDAEAAEEEQLTPMSVCQFFGAMGMLLAALPAIIGA